MSEKSFVNLVVKSSNSPIHFIVCKDEQGHIAHYFIKTSRDKIKLLQENRKSHINITDYGVVIASGFGAQPSMATKRVLKKDHGYDYDTIAASSN